MECYPRVRLHLRDHLWAGLALGLVHLEQAHGGQQEDHGPLHLSRIRNPLESRGRRRSDGLRASNQAKKRAGVRLPAQQGPGRLLRASGRGRPDQAFPERVMLILRIILI